MGIFGVFMLIKVIFMLVVSFFVLFAVSKTDSRGLQQFGRILAFSIWIIAIYILAVNLYARGIRNVHYGSKAVRYGKKMSGRTLPGYPMKKMPNCNK
ncbi:MAG: hypothetical protein PHU64_04845 [Candidatus Omnitrophica bacterium]|nr:hypothetical protein [Candidatus Omnitrophota bacterium]MDD5429738.1 hypothetical protein [Candidatus Omnitrophota bacterium]